MILEPVIKLGKMKTTSSKKKKKEKETMMSCWKIVKSLSFFWFLANLEESESQIPDVWSVAPTFSLTVTFYLAKTESRTKKSLT